MSDAPRVLMANWSARRTGGAERYLEQAIAALHEHGIPVALWAECDAPDERAPIALDAGVPRWVGAAGLAAARAWAPTLVMLHGVTGQDALPALAALAPAAFVSHNYLGTCISGTKTHRSLTPRACGRTLGWPCLLHYFPDRCGGWSPVTMVRRYRENRATLDDMRAGAGIVALSGHMADELARHGVRRERIHVVPPSVEPAERPVPPAPAPGEPWRLLFVGRLDALKGGAMLVDALPGAAAALGRPVTLTVVGDGPDRAHIEERAASLARSPGAPRVTCVGWVAGVAAMREVFARHHLLVMPSLWPEPFGLVGLEAGAAGMPTVAFDSGGIPDWLADGVGGILVRDRPRTATALAQGIARALADAATWCGLSRGARAAAAAHDHDRFARGMAAAVRRLATAGAA